MWQQNSYPDYGGKQPQPAVPGVPAEAGVDWGVAAQQWLRNKEFYEQWQKQQYQQHLQMMAAAHAAQMAQCIDPSVVNNPPPPPPLPEISNEENLKIDSSENTDMKTDDLKLNDSNDKASPSKMKTNILTGPKPGSSNSSNVSTLKKSSIPSLLGKNLTKSSTLFAAYDQAQAKNSATTEEGQNSLNDDASDVFNSDYNEKSHGKQLPMWLREGLEKIKQEKEKKKENSKADPIPTPKPTISTVFNDDDEEESEEEINKLAKKDRLRHPPLGVKLNTDSAKLIAKPPKLELSEEDKQEIIMGLLKAWMTEILLEVTNSEMQQVAKEVFQYEKDQKLKQELKKTKASLNLGYGIGDDEEENESENENDDDSEPDEENIEFLKKRAEQKLKDYEIKFQREQKELSYKESNKKASRKDRSRSRSGNRRSVSRHRGRSSSRHRHRNRRSRTRSRTHSRDRRDRRRRRSSTSSSSSRERSKNRSKRSSRSKSRERSKKSSKKSHRSRSKSHRKKSSRRRSTSSSNSSRSRSNSRSKRIK